MSNYINFLPTGKGLYLKYEDYLLFAVGVDITGGKDKVGLQKI